MCCSKAPQTVQSADDLPALMFRGADSLQFMRKLKLLYNWTLALRRRALPVLTRVGYNSGAS